MLTEDCTSLLPGVLREIEPLIGMAATLRLVEAYGGVRLYVPRQMHARHPLARLLGLDAAQRLAEMFGGEEHFDIPRAVAIARQVRNRQLRSERNEKSQRELALQYGLTERQVRNILGDQDDAQQELPFS